MPPLSGIRPIAEIDGLTLGGNAAIVEILAGAEAAACARQHDHPGITELREGIAEFLVHLAVEAVQPVRPVERYAGNTVVKLELDGLVLGHGALPDPSP